MKVLNPFNLGDAEGPVIEAAAAQPKKRSPDSSSSGLRGPAELRTVTRAHVIAWRKDLEKRELASSSIRRKPSALSALFDYLCERNAVGNPV